MTRPHVRRRHWIAGAVLGLVWLATGNPSLTINTAIVVFLALAFVRLVGWVRGGAETRPPEREVDPPPEPDWDRVIAHRQKAAHAEDPAEAYRHMQKAEDLADRFKRQEMRGRPRVQVSDIEG